MKKKRNIIKVFLSISLCLLCSFCMTGCFDLGNYSTDGKPISGFDYSSYYETFGEVVGLYKKGIQEDLPFGDKVKYDVEKSLLNKTTANEGKWVNDDDIVLTHEYVYIAIPIKKSFKMGNFALCMKAGRVENPTIRMDINVYLLGKDEKIPENICYVGSPTAKIVYDGEHEYEEEIVYDDPKDKTPIAKTGVYPVVGQWVSFLIDDWVCEERNSPIIDVHAGDTILLQFVSNTGYVHFAERNSCEFSFINLLIYSYKEVS